MASGNPALLNDRVSAFVILHATAQSARHHPHPPFYINAVRWNLIGFTFTLENLLFYNL